MHFRRYSDVPATAVEFCIQGVRQLHLNWLLLAIYTVQTMNFYWKWNHFVSIICFLTFQDLANILQKNLFKESAVSTVPFLRYTTNLTPMANFLPDTMTNEAILSQLASRRLNILYISSRLRLTQILFVENTCTTAYFHLL